MNCPKCNEDIEYFVFNETSKGVGKYFFEVEESYTDETHIFKRTYHCPQCKYLLARNDKDLNSLPLRIFQQTVS